MGNVRCGVASKKNYSVVEFVHWSPHGITHQNNGLNSRHGVHMSDNFYIFGTCGKERTLKEIPINIVYPLVI